MFPVLSEGRVLSDRAVMIRLLVAVAVLSFSAPAWAQSSSSSAAVDRTSLGDHQALLTSFHSRIDEIEGRIAVSEGLVATLKENALGSVIARTYAVIEHRNEMGSGFELESAVYTLDGGTIFTKENVDGTLDAQRAFELYNGPITPGQHTIEVSLLFRGKSAGVFTYLEGYKYKINSKYALDVPEGKSTRLAIVAYERDDITMETEDRLSVRYDVEIGSGPKKAEPETSADED